MTRKQYVKKMRQLQRNIAKSAKAEGNKIATADRIRTPIWGSEITVGRHAGERLTSYAQAWDTLCDVMKGTDVMKGIE